MLLIGGKVKLTYHHMTQLQVLLDECCQLGRSYDLVVAAQALRGELDGFLGLFYHNAKQLSPQVQDPGQVIKQFAHGAVDNKSLPDQLESVATAVKMLRDRLNEYREYTVCFVLRPKHHSAT